VVALKHCADSLRFAQVIFFCDILRTCLFIITNTYNVTSCPATIKSLYKRNPVVTLALAWSSNHSSTLYPCLLLHRHSIKTVRGVSTTKSSNIFLYVSYLQNSALTHVIVKNKAVLVVKELEFKMWKFILKCEEIWFKF